MIAPVDTAVILAAGMGTRLKGYTQDQPKGFLEIDGKSLIDRSISLLLSSGIKNIIIGTGYFHEHFDALRLKYDGITTLKNADFATTGSMYTLYVVRHLVQGPFLLLESDLLYDPAALGFVLHDERDDIILASGPTRSGDEVYIQHSAGGFLQNMSKNRSVLDYVSGELVGITKLSRETLRQMASFSEPHFADGNSMLNYEDALVGTAVHHNIFVKVIQDLAWCEIDDENHLQRAVAQVYPAILARTKRA